MAYNKTKFDKLISLEVPYRIALALSDDSNPLSTSSTAAAVTDAGALGSTTVSAADGTAAGASYVQATAATWVTLMNETKADVNALRTDVSNLRTKVNELLAALRASGGIAP